MTFQRGAPAEERFWAKVDKRGPDECWPWLASTDRAGYGRFAVISGVEWESAHRFSWRLAFGEIPAGMCVCHACDNRPCCNHRHLWLGTQLENIADREAKGRNVNKVGEQKPQAKLTDEKVRLIRGSDEPHTVLGRRFGVSPQAVLLVRKRKSWKHVA